MAQGWWSEKLTGEGNNYYDIIDRMEAYYNTHSKGKGSGYKQYKRWAIRNESRYYPSGNIFNYQAKDLKEYRGYMKAHPELKVESRATNGHWVPLGPYEWTEGFSSSGGLGRVNCIGFHPTDPNIFYVGTPAGGLWRTTTGGSTWQSMTDGLPSIGVSSIIVHPTNADIIYLLTGDGDAGETPSIGVLKSTDGGFTWLETALSWPDKDYHRPYKMVMHPTNSNILFVASSNGIFRTLNGGQTWPSVKGGYYTDIEFHPTDPDTIYAARLSGVYRSTDGGNNFIRNTDPDINNLVHNEDYHRIALAVSPDEPDYLYALYGGGPTGLQGVYRSINSGSTFGFVMNSPNLLSNQSGGADSSHQAIFDLAFDINPTDVSSMFVGGVNVWKSDNHGVNWTLKSEWFDVNSSVGFTHADIHNINYRGPDVFVCSDGGIFKSVNDGEDWINLTNAITVTQIYDFDVYNNIIICGTQDNGSMKWSALDFNLEATGTYGGDGFECFIDPSSPSVIYQCSQGNRARSTNGGSSWCDITPPIAGCTFNDDDDGGQWDASWVMHPTNFDTIYAATQTLYRSYDRGANWTEIGLPTSDGTPAIRAIAQGKNNPNVMYTSNRTNLRRADNLHDADPAWFNISGNGQLPFDSAQLGGIAVDPNNSSRVWVTFRGYRNNKKVYYSSNAGSTWTNISGSLPNVPARCIYYQAGSNDGIYVGTSIGVFYKNASLSDWIFFSNGLPNVPVEDFDIDNGYLYIATWGRGVWRTNPYSNCPSENMLTVFNDPSNGYHTGTQVYHASSAIASTRKVTGGIGTNVLYQAGSFVRLDHGFEARAESTFEAKIGGCPQ
jgi:photosystem II stability/assembly factor-like uncharacterized protein